MKLHDLKINGESNLLSVRLNNLSFSFISDLLDEYYIASLFSDDVLLHQEKIAKENIHCFYLKYDYKKETSYKIVITDLSNKESISMLFKTEIDFTYNFITVNDDITHPTFYKPIIINKRINKATLYITGLGLYVAFINNQKVGDYFLTPGFNDYDGYLRYQAYDVSNLLKNSNNLLEVTLGDGWYKGRIGFDGGFTNVWGDKYLLSACLKIEYEDGTKEEIATDESFKCKTSKYISTSIYDGENIDETKAIKDDLAVKVINKKYNIIAQDGCFITKYKEITPELIISNSGERILDFKQNVAGYVRFVIRNKRGEKILLQYGEILQDGCFYNENLRSAKSEVQIICDGTIHTYDEYFTYHGFRYVKVTGIDSIDVNDFKAIVISSYKDEQVKFECNDKRINQLISNVKWGQIDNFVDIPTDCPQRDERLGWTADTQVFSSTAMYNTNCYSFYKKYLDDLRVEQKRYYKGNIPSFAPSLKKKTNEGGAVWSDVATILPMNMYYIYGNKELLKDNYQLMKDYCDSLIKHDRSTQNRHLILDGFTFGDWLAQDGVTKDSMKGGTDDNYIQSMYYYYSISLLIKASEILNIECKKYINLQKKIKKAILDEFFSKNGRLTIDTQTGYILSLYLNVYVNKDRIIEGLKNRFIKDCYLIKTGFTGTPLIMDVLFDNGLDDIAYRILFNDKCPGWLYQVNLGATTVFERWNSVLDDGKINKTGMNSLNHYANGSVSHAIYSKICGLENDGIGFNRAIIRPHINYRLPQIDFAYKSINGEYKIKYNITKDNSLICNIVVPSNCHVKLYLPEKDMFELDGGEYSYNYKLSTNYSHPYSKETKIVDLLADEKAINVLKTNMKIFFIGSGIELSVNSLAELQQMHFLPIEKEEIDELDKLLKGISIYE